MLATVRSGLRCVCSLLTGIGDYAPKDYAQMPVIFMANEGKPNVAIVAWEYVNDSEPHAFSLMALCDIKAGEEVH
jgi:hypothetical protein